MVKQVAGAQFQRSQVWAGLVEVSAPHSLNLGFQGRAHGSGQDSVGWCWKAMSQYKFLFGNLGSKVQRLLLFRSSNHSAIF